ncbi:MerR family transcriptional regulator [Caulobacter rhizosphaerae]|nr:MerR family transcriptional regulator [Caulobacter rhizosphaerae]KQZ20021.1 hypothetical protein ASD47_25785 [Caulobacter sp. Root1472]
MMTGRPTPSAQAGPRRLVMIADLAEQLGVTARALRHYEDVGLIRSERTTGNARAYDLETVEILKAIVRLRQVDVPLAVIDGIVRQGSDPSVQALAIRQALDAVLADKKQALARVVALIKTMDIRDEGGPTTAPRSEPPRSGRFMRSAESAAAAREAG